MSTRLFLALTLALLAPAALAQKQAPQEVVAPMPPPPEAPDVPHATARAAPRPVPADDLRRLAEDAAHRYGRGVQERPTWWDLFWRWVEERLLRPMFSEGARPFWTYVVPALAVLALAWALTRLIRGEGSGLFARRDRPAEPEAGPLLDVEDIAAVDLGRRLDEARAAGRRRDVVRYRFLRALQALAARGAVVWRKDRTNRDYLLALRRAAPDAAAPFAEAARVFAWVWYGDYRLDDGAFAAAERALDRLDRAVEAVPATAETAPVPEVPAGVYE